ncbi:MULTISPECIES: MFS transporter [unclassified Streptomyces]|uniref:MFS transporter n=1 Tax=unclassified Streptomyces TaxID=2593676 RepID=UPI0034269DC0
MPGTGPHRRHPGEGPITAALLASREEVLGGIAIAGIATAAVGPPIGGLLVGAAGWRWAFLINIPVTLIAMAMAVRRLPKDRVPDRGHGGLRRIADRIDLPGILGFAVSMSALVRPPRAAPRFGPTSRTACGKRSACTFRAVLRRWTQT